MGVIISRLLIFQRYVCLKYNKHDLYMLQCIETKDPVEHKMFGDETRSNMFVDQIFNVFRDVGNRVSN